MNVNKVFTRNYCYCNRLKTSGDHFNPVRFLLGFSKLKMYLHKLNLISQRSITSSMFISTQGFMIKSVCIFLFGIFVLKCQMLAQPQKKFSAKAYKEDLAYLQEAINDIHPAAFRYYTKEAMDSLYRAQTANLQDSVTYLALFKAANQLVAMVSCIHTTVQSALNSAPTAGACARCPSGFGTMANGCT